MASMHQEAERSWSMATGDVPTGAVGKTAYGERRGQNMRLKICLKRACDNARPACAVMLHVRARYVSKAAILTVPASPMPVENRSPA